MSSKFHSRFFTGSKTVELFRECWQKWDPLRVVIHCFEGMFLSEER